MIKFQLGSPRGGISLQHPTTQLAISMSNSGITNMPAVRTVKTVHRMAIYSHVLSRRLRDMVRTVSLDKPPPLVTISS